MSLRSKLLASALAGALVFAPVQVHIQKEGESFSFSVKRAEAFAPSVSVAFTALSEAFTSALPAALASVGLGLAVVGLGVLVWKKDTIIDFLKEHTSISVGDVGGTVTYTSPTNSTSTSFKLEKYGSFLGFTILSWHVSGSCESEGILDLMSGCSSGHNDQIVYCYGGNTWWIEVPSCSLTFLDSETEESVTVVRPDLIPGNLQNLPHPEEFYSDVSEVPEDIVVADVPPADDSVPSDSLLYVSPDGIFLSPPDSSSDTDAQNPADTAVTDSSPATTDAQNPADTAVTDSSPATTDAQNPADTDAAADNPTDVIVKNPADIAKAIDDVASKSVPTANSTALPDVPTFKTTVSTPEVPNILDKFKSIASSLKLTDKVTTSFSGSCSISGSLDLWGNSVPYNIDFCPYAPYLEQAGDILVMVSGFAALLIMFGL